MSYKNRKKEYDRLKSLNRDNDIPQNLLDEFGPVEKLDSVPSKSTKRKK